MLLQSTAAHAHQSLSVSASAALCCYNKVPAVLTLNTRLFCSCTHKPISVSCLFVTIRHFLSSFFGYGGYDTGLFVDGFVCISWNAGSFSSGRSVHIWVLAVCLNNRKRIHFSFICFCVVISSSIKLCFFFPLQVLLCGKGEILEMGLICNWTVLSCSLIDWFCLFCFCFYFAFRMSIAPWLLQFYGNSYSLDYWVLNFKLTYLPSEICLFAAVGSS